MGHPAVTSAWRDTIIDRTWIILVFLASLTTGFDLRSVEVSSFPQTKNSLSSPTTITFKPWELVNALAWSPDGNLLAVSAGNKISIFQMETMQQRQVWQLDSMTQGLAFSPDGHYLAASSRDGFLRVWRMKETGVAANKAIADQAPVWQTNAHRKGANALAFSPDGSILASGGNDGMARLWQSETGKPLNAIIGGTFSVPGLAFNPDGTSLAIVNGNMIRLRDTATGRIIGSLRSEKPLYSISYHPGGKLLAVGDSDNHILLWDPAQSFRSGNLKYPQPVLLSGHNGQPDTSRALIWNVLFSSDGTLLASAGGDGTVRIWDVNQGRLLFTLTGHTNAVTSLAFSPDNRILASGSLDGTVRLWDLEDQARSAVAPWLALQR
ncbi:MAG: hypothetical protein H6Q38_2682 [Chloroflexi bacterium]|nr:hypothetical protein [Chloroflexota bacterium]